MELSNTKKKLEKLEFRSLNVSGCRISRIPPEINNEVKKESGGLFEGIARLRSAESKRRNEREMTEINLGGQIKGNEKEEKITRRSTS